MLSTARVVQLEKLWTSTRDDYMRVDARNTYCLVDDVFLAFGNRDEMLKHFRSEICSQTGVYMTTVG